ncbi:MAG: carboxypeptidase-like regulatory domain-containing protein, partial [Bacteroidales bacterium]|nr:carboxypeptidase-like regulatory domain-containing protein [Bacteroidales bacterium]
MSKVRFHICLFLIINLLWPITSFGQAEKYTVPASLNNSTWIEFMDHTTEVLIVKYYVQADSMPEFRMEIASDSLSLITVLKMNLEPLGFHVATDGHSTFFITEGISIKTQLPVGFFNRVDAKALADQQMFQQKSSDGQLTTSNVYVAKTIVIGNRDRRKQQKKCKLSGIVTNAFDGQPIIGGTIYVNELKTGTATDENGYYQLELLPEKYTLTFRSLESIERMVKIDMQSSGTLNLTLDQNLYLLQEVEVKSSQNDNIRGTQMGFEKISGKMIKEIPVVLGEQDIIKVALLLPGVNTIGEGAAGFNVRGSSADQNLFYIENTPVYNTSHLFGFFSAFNPDIIDNFTLYKGSIPARFGGRLSSIFDITTKTGNMEQFSARGGISPITARLMVEGPILKNKVSYIAGIRSTYSDWVLQMVKDPEIRDSKAYFGDVVLGFDARINTKNKLKLFGYYSEDRIKLANSTNYEFKNQGAS